MVSAAQHHKIVEAGMTALTEPFDVVGVAESRRPIAARKAAMLVAGDQRRPQPGGDDSGGTAVVEDLGVAGHDQPMQLAVSQCHRRRD